MNWPLCRWAELFHGVMHFRRSNGEVKQHLAHCAGFLVVWGVGSSREEVVFQAPQPVAWSPAGDNGCSGLTCVTGFSWIDSLPYQRVLCSDPSITCPFVHDWGSPCACQHVFFALFLLPLLLVVDTADGRVWKDQTGNYTIEGNLFAYDDEHVVIERGDGDLGMFEIEFLSEEDREYLRSTEGVERSKKHLDEEQSWELIDGYKLIGTLVDYTRTKVTIQRRRGKIYVNDRLFDALPPVYQTIVIKTLGQFEQIADVDQDKFTRWVAQLHGRPRTFDVDGIVMELKDGNEYTIPFVLFNPRSLRLLRGGWEAWLSASESKDYNALNDESFHLQAQAAAIIRNQQISQQIAVTQYNLDLVRSGITSLWEVTLYPGPGNPFPPRWVMAQGRTNIQAVNMALQQNPGFVAGPVRRIR